jgi:hypothetical protein
VEKYCTARQTENDKMRHRSDAICMLEYYGKDIRTHTHFIRIAFPWQQKLRERASMLRYTYMACLACPQKNA